MVRLSNDAATVENTFVVPQKVIKLSYGPLILLPGKHPKMLKALYTKDYRSIIHNSQKQKQRKCALTDE